MEERFVINDDIIQKLYIAVEIMILDNNAGVTTGILCTHNVK